MYCFRFESSNGHRDEWLIRKPMTVNRTTITFHWIDDSQQRIKCAIPFLNIKWRLSHSKPFLFTEDTALNADGFYVFQWFQLFFAPFSHFFSIFSVYLFPYASVVMTIHFNRRHCMLTLIYHLPFSSIGTFRMLRLAESNNKSQNTHEIRERYMTFHNIPKPTKWINFKILFHVLLKFIHFLFIALSDHSKSSNYICTQSWRILIDSVNRCPTIATRRKKKLFVQFKIKCKFVRLILWNVAWTSAPEMYKNHLAFCVLAFSPFIHFSFSPFLFSLLRVR